MIQCSNQQQMFKVSMSMIPSKKKWEKKKKTLDLNMYRCTYISQENTYTSHPQTQTTPPLQSLLSFSYFLKSVTLGRTNDLAATKSRNLILSRRLIAE